MNYGAFIPPATGTARAFVGLGTNRARRRWRVRRALRAIDDIPHTRLLTVSQLYRNAAVGPGIQPYYLNVVAELATRLAPMGLLRALQDIEQRHQRRRRRVRASPRTIDLDLLLYGSRILMRGPLILPHPRMHLRDFVLFPLAEIAPWVRIPGREPLAELVSSQPEGRFVGDALRFGSRRK